MSQHDQSALYLDIVERCALALGHTLSPHDWETVWHNRRETSPYSVLVELQIVASEGSALESA
jgi:hypothetical protein